MTCLNELELDNFRLFSRLRWRPAAGLNFIAGANGVGKSSVLEATYFLGRGRSFRAARSAELIKNSNLDAQDGAPPPSGERPAGAPTRLRAVISPAPPAGGAAGGAAQTGAAPPNADEVVLLLQGAPAAAAKQLYLNKSPQDSAAKVARKLPLVLAAPHNVNLVDAAPNHRRAFLDGLLFHTEPAYGELHRRYERCLRQRNKALIQAAAGRAEQQLPGWDGQLAELGGQLEARREQLLPRLLASLREIAAEFKLEQCEISYYRGWAKEQTLAQALRASCRQDLARGFTACGCHRADFKLSIKSSPASRILSLGQQKLFSLSFFCAAAALLAAANGGRPPLILLDDIAAQLDAANCGLLIDYLRARQAQVFITATGSESLVKYNRAGESACWHLSAAGMAESSP